MVVVAVGKFSVFIFLFFSQEGGGGRGVGAEGCLVAMQGVVVVVAAA